MKMPLFKTAVSWGFLFTLVIAITCFFYFQWYEYLSFTAFKQYHSWLLFFVEQHTVEAILLYMTIYALTITLCVPDSFFVTVLGGYLFGTAATIYVAASATLGCTLLFLIVRTTLGNWLIHRSSGWITKLEKGFQKNSFWYLLSLRLMPFMPFWVVNMVAGVLGVKPKTFIAATFFGVIPCTFIYVLIGSHLNALLKDNQPLDFNHLMSPSILFPLASLAVLAIFFVWYTWREERV